MIGQPSGSLDLIALIVKVFDLVFGCDRLGLRLGEAGAAYVGQIAEREHLR